MKASHWSAGASYRHMSFGIVMSIVLMGGTHLALRDDVANFEYQHVADHELVVTATRLVESSTEPRAVTRTAQSNPQRRAPVQGIVIRN